MSGWFEKVKIKLNSTQVVVEVEVGVELGNIQDVDHHHINSGFSTASFQVTKSEMVSLRHTISTILLPII